MTSYASYMPSSPGIIYHSPGNNNDHKQKKQQQQHEQEKLASVHKENMRLKASLTRVQNEYEELRDESNYQRAKVSELSDQIVSNRKQKQLSSSISASNYYNNSGSGVTSSKTNECGESTVHKRLIDTSLQNAELNLTIDNLKIQVRQTEMKMEELQIQKRFNNKLLLEMSDVVRALNSVHIEYEYNDSSSANKKEGSEHLNAQQSSIKKIKSKVEAIMKDRSLLVRRCKKLDEETFNQQQQIKVLEAQFHIVNTTNIYKGIALDDDETYTTHTAHTTATSTKANATSNTIGIIAPNSPNSVYSIAAQSAVSNMTPITMQHDVEQEEEEESSIMMSTSSSPQTQRSPAAEYVRQSKELARHKQHEEEQLKELTELKESKDIQIDTIRRLRLENERITKCMQSLQHELSNTKEDKQDSIIKRDEYKDSLYDIVVHYKQLNTEHMSTQKQLESLQSYVNELEIELQETKDECQQKHQEEEEEKECNTHEEEAVVDDKSPVKMEDLVVAYDRAMKKINTLETNLLSVHGLSKNNRDRKNYCDTINRYKKIEMERNNFQRRLNRALEETRIAKMETKNVREEAKHVRKRLTSFLQKKNCKDDDGNNNNSTSNKLPSSSLPLPTWTSTSTMGMKQQQNKVVVPFKPLSIEELMKKDFA
jgi:hypothetical protein